ncbi:mannitol-1-phosphate 5-dehydrogenase [Gordoniibacillus kamchatkensis]|uniref:Mannitol-1-phosphate 5-dehydrogenase n=1 Tax=Gordoniibacillus kamchatkensis TaxID=1590651 RepID=A0ABR5AM74_9BACL|nr:mannitol-1-phosphate 5-dehydrogenase [Paenibacillus sp. VKM B-2647]KIL42137.1 mannitol-1-phosphate 5-dehydrogenase [Paenibacillus sp. VKM B-2647]
MKVVHFGAGNIGRGFIGLLLSQSGYEVVFVDVSDELVSRLQEKQQYVVNLANDEREQIVVSGVTAINGKEPERVAEAVAQADLVTTAVGVNVLKHIAEGIARGIEKRLESGGAGPLHVIACENAIGGSTQLKEHVYERLNEELRSKADAIVAFPDAAVDRIVPIQHHEDPLMVTVEPYCEWVVDRSRMLPGARPIQGVHYVDELEPYIERKLFTVNTGHCCAAYLGYIYGYGTIQDSMADAGIVAKVQAVLEETGAMLIGKYGFDRTEHEQYVAKIVGRFQNPHLTDEVVRVGRSPIRKLSPNDRLVRPALQLYEMGTAPVHLAGAMAAALLFDYPEDPEAQEIQAEIRANGLAAAISKFTAIGEEHPIHRSVIREYERLQRLAVRK